MDVVLETAQAAGIDPRVLARFDQASSELLEARALQQRIDRKYLLPKGLMDSLLEGLGAHYRVARAGDALLARYDTLYFDTSDRLMYEDHRRGRRPRFKVRVRHHLERRLTFLEIKRKDTNACTRKARLGLPFGETRFGDDARQFIDAHCPVGAARLIPLVSVAFFRLTLVREHANERVTFDWNIEFRDGQRCHRETDLVIVEIKQARYSNITSVVEALRRLHVRERPLSKYCLATVRLAGVRANIFRPTLRAVERLSA
jgi:VTC domain